MGQEIVVEGESGAFPSVSTLCERLAAASQPALVAMVDGQLWPPDRPVPATWSDVRLRLPGGMVTVRRHPRGLAVVVFGNADAALAAAQRAVAQALRPG